MVNQRNLSRATGPPPPKASSKGKGKKKKKKGALSLGELMTTGSDGEDFDAPPPAPPSPGGVPVKCVFSSTHHTPEQRLYYLLATRPSPKHSAGAQRQQLSGGGGSIDAAAGAVAAVEGGCHAVVFVETTADAQELVGVLKALNLVAFALHDRTPKAQVTLQSRSCHMRAAVGLLLSSRSRETNAVVQDCGKLQLFRTSSSCR